MTILNLVYIVIAILLVLLNAFFVLAEFAIVKVRETRIEELSKKGDKRAVLARSFIKQLDNYLSATQLGITIASLGLGWIGEPAFAAVIKPLLDMPGIWPSVVSHSVSLAVAFLVITFLHIIVGELAPKSLAIRKPEVSALLVAWPMRVFYILFYPPLIALNWASNLILRAIGIDVASQADLAYSQEELRIILSGSQKKGAFSFNRLLFFENLIDMDSTKVEHAMVPLNKARVLVEDAPWEENLETIRQSKFSRYPLVKARSMEIIGIVHVKDLVLDPDIPSSPDGLRKVVRPALKVPYTQSLETTLERLQKGSSHMAVVTDSRGRSIGIVTLEDIFEELVGDIEDEFEREPRYSLADFIPPNGILLDLKGGRCEDVVSELLRTVSKDGLGCDPSRAINACMKREEVISTNIGKGIAIPHARLPELKGPVLLIGRSRKGIIFGPDTLEPVRLVFLLLTPSSQAHSQAGILARIAGIVQSRFVRERLLSAGTPQEVAEIVRSGDPHALR